MSLIGAELERQGVATVAIQHLRFVAERVGPPRALLVPFPHGYALGAPGKRMRQLDVLTASLGLFEKKDASPPLLEEFLGARARAAIGEPRRPDPLL